jgi:D-beta-D-heptose 7-phosphate kinase/D-beta-D-heptose 1-phosphate adenosyltransferase
MLCIKKADMYYVKEAQRLISHYRASEPTTVTGFCNGCFDGLHAGHLNLLKEANKVCSVLIVGLNTDEYIKRVKGPHRPLFVYDDRAMMIVRAIEPKTSLMIIEQQQDTPFELIKYLAIQVLIKSTEYENTEEVRYMQTNKKRVLFVPRMPDVSTSSLMEVK